MKKFLCCLFLLSTSFSIANAQTCNNWLYNPSVSSSVNIGDLDVTGNQITVEATINRTTPYLPGVGNDTEGDVVSKHNGPEDANYLLRPNHAYITTSDGFFGTPDVCEIELNKTYHVALVYDGSTLKFYRNGFLMSRVNATGNLFQNNWNTRFGHYDPAFFTTQFIGYINEVRIWNTARSQADLNIYLNISLPNPTTQPGLVGYYTFDNLLNKQGNALFNGAINGAATINQTNPNCILIKDTCEKIVSNNGIGNIINSYTPVIALNECDNKITVEDAGAFNTGDTVLIIQMKGAVIDSSNTASFGTITDYKNAGNYEFNYVKSKAGNIIELKDSLTRAYDVPVGKVQLIRVPYYNTANVISTLTCLPWDGDKGGVLVLNAKDSVNLYADIDVTAKGFRGGNGAHGVPQAVSCSENQYYYIQGSELAAEKGEGISILSPDKALGKGRSTNGGGGGDSHNAGGGGGGNGATAGNGGYQYELTPCDAVLPFDNGGLPGKALAYNNTQNKIYAGGGGGAGHANNPQLFFPKGGNGGGILIIKTNIIRSISGSVISRGENATECSANTVACHEGMGGGGSGGTIIAEVNQTVGNLVYDIAGGKGGDMAAPAGLGKLGPGGGGSGGVFWNSQVSNSPGISINKAGGIAGVNTNYGNDNWGAAPGLDGINLFSLKIPVDTKPFKKNIDSVRIKAKAISCNTFDFVGIAYIAKYPIKKWHWDFGDGNFADVANTSHSFTNANAYNITLTVTDDSGCTDSTKTAITTAGIYFDFSYKQDVCNPLSVQFFNIGGTPLNPLWLFGDGNTVSGNASPVHVYAASGNYPVQYTVQNAGCTDTITKNISVSILKDNIILTADTTICFGTTKQLITKPSLGFCWSPTTYLSDPNNANPTTSTPVPITYYLTAEIPGSNLITNGDFSGGNTGFTSKYNFAPVNTTEGEYFVGLNPQNWNASLSPCTDHTTGSGNMLLVNGAPLADVNVWNQTVTIAPNTNYAFSTWVQALWPPNPAQLSFSINGGTLGNLITASLPTCTWTQFYTTWNSGNNTSATISIVNKNTFVQGNDFALDDISFSPVVIKRDSVVISIDKPVIKASNDTLVCAGSNVQLTAAGAATYNWLPAAGLSNAAISNPIAAAANTTQYIVTGITAKGCAAADTVIVTTKPLPVITKTPDTVICNNTNVQLFVSGGISYQWSPAAGLSNIAIPNPVASPVNTTAYNVIVTGANSCIKTDSVKITVRPKPVFTVSPADTTCLNTAVQLKASGGDVYSWSPAAMVSNAAIAAPNTVGNTSTNYTVVIKELACNNSATLNTSVTVLPVPVIKASKSNDINCSIGASQLSVSGTGQYIWSPAISLNNNEVASPVATPAATTVYQVTSTDVVTSCIATDTVTVFVNKGGITSFFIPSAFSPNGDGVNDCFKVKSYTFLKSVDISIYNRFGNIVYHSTTDNDCWDGTYKGSPAEAGNYVYYIKTADNCDPFFRKGNLVLIR
jgi:gliding motility-associated-like protein